MILHLTFVRTSEEGTVIILNKILRYFTCKSSFLNIDMCGAGIYYYYLITLLGIPKERRCDKEDCRILRK
jgi:hypothetical protein